jgi:hypothetical protein
MEDRRSKQRRRLRAERMRELKEMLAAGVLQKQEFVDECEELRKQPLEAFDPDEKPAPKKPAPKKAAPKKAARKPAKKTPKKKRK